MADDEFAYHGSDDALSNWLRMFTSRNGDGSGDPEENYLAAIKLAAGCKAGGAFLDIGSGLGRILDILKPFAGSVIGIEPDKPRFLACRDGAQRAPHVEVLNCFTNDLRKARPGSSFDLITLSMVLQHVSTKTCDELLASIRDMLTPSGVAIIATTHFFEERFTYEGDSSAKDRTQYDHYAEHTSQQDRGIPVRLFSRDSFTSAIEMAGLEWLVWQQFFYVRPERLDTISADFGVAIDDIRDVGFSQYCVARRAGSAAEQGRASGLLRPLRTWLGRAPLRTAK